MDMRQPRNNPGFRDMVTAPDLEIRFRKEDKQMNLFSDVRQVAWYDNTLGSPAKDFRKKVVSVTTRNRIYLRALATTSL